MPPKFASTPLPPCMPQHCIIQTILTKISVLEIEPGETAKFSCRLCINYHGIGEKSIVRKSVPGHLASQHHLNAVEAENLRVLHGANQGHNTSSSNSQILGLTASLPSISTHPVSPKATNGPEDLSFSDFFTDADFANTEFSAGETVHHNMAAKLRQQLEDFGIWDEEALARELGFGTRLPADELPNLTDDTLTNVMQDMGTNHFCFNYHIFLDSNLFAILGL